MRIHKDAPELAALLKKFIADCHAGKRWPHITTNRITGELIIRETSE